MLLLIRIEWGQARDRWMSDLISADDVVQCEGFCSCRCSRDPRIAEVPELKSPSCSRRHSTLEQHECRKELAKVTVITSELRRHESSKPGDTNIKWSRRRPVRADQHRWHAMPVDGNISNAMLLLPCVGAVQPTHSPALTQPLAEVSVVVVGGQLLRLTARRRPVHCPLLHSPTHLLRVATAMMPVMNEPMRTPLQVLELTLLMCPKIWS